MPTFKRPKMQIFEDSPEWPKPEQTQARWQPLTRELWEQFLFDLEWQRCPHCGKDIKQGWPSYFAHCFEKHREKYAGREWTQEEIFVAARMGGKDGAAARSYILTGYPKMYGPPPFPKPLTFNERIKRDLLAYDIHSAQRTPA